MDEPNLLSDKSYQDFYAEQGFFGVWTRSYLSAHSIVLHSAYVIIALLISVFIKIDYPFQFRSYIGVFSDIILTYSSTIIGFLLVSFSILLSLSNVRNTFNYFVKKNDIYKRPLLKVILDHFIFPIGIFLILLIISLFLKIFNGFSLLSDVNLIIKNTIFRVLLGVYCILIFLSVSELVSYFFNMYRFIVITSFTVSKEYEETILKKIYVDKEKVDILSQDDAAIIIQYQEDKKKES